MVGVEANEDKISDDKGTNKANNGIGNIIADVLQANKTKEKIENPFTGDYDKHIKTIEGRDDENIKKWVIAGLRDNTFHPLPIYIRDYSSEALENFMQNVINTYGERGEQIFEKIKKQVKKISEEFDRELKSYNSENLNSSDSKIKKEARFLAELLELINEWKL